MDYVEKLKDPRWQKKRLEIFERDKWTCNCCGSKEKTLCVHHLFYFKDKDPWEIHDGFLLTLCEDCHSIEKEPDEDCSIKDSIVRDIGLILYSIWKSGYGVYDLVEIASAINDRPRPSGPVIECKLFSRPFKFKLEGEK